jgi:hypothetical protein
MRPTAKPGAPRSTATLPRAVNDNSLGAEINGTLVPHP